jgi:hypothetical protein
MRFDFIAVPRDRFDQRSARSRNLGYDLSDNRGHGHMRGDGHLHDHSHDRSHRHSHSSKRLNRRNALASVVLNVVQCVLVAFPAHAQTCPFDDGNSALTREGLILTRYALGIRENALVANTGIDAVDWPTVQATILCPSCGLDINGNGGFDQTDATIISRKIAGITGTALTDGLSLGSGSRNTPAAVNSFLLSGCGLTGGTVTSISAGTGLSGGTITTSGTIGIAAGGVGTFELAADSVTSSKIAANSVGTSEIADGSVTQLKFNETVQPFAGALLSSTGANPGGSLKWVSPPALSCVAGTSAGAATITSGNQGCATATCPAGYMVTGGGLTGGSTNTGTLFQYVNYASGNGWQVCIVVGGSGASATFSANARCCKVE